MRLKIERTIYSNQPLARLFTDLIKETNQRQVLTMTIKLPRCPTLGVNIVMSVFTPSISPHFVHVLQFYNATTSAVYKPRSYRIPTYQISKRKETIEDYQIKQNIKRASKKRSLFTFKVHQVLVRNSHGFVSIQTDTALRGLGDDTSTGSDAWTGRCR